MVTTISCNGNILVNVGPSKHGLIEPIFVERLRDMGKWLKINGEAIYESVPWIYQNDTKTPNVWYTTRNDNVDDSKRVNIYAIVLNYPYDGAGINLYALGDKFDNTTKVTMLGYPKNLNVIASIDFVSFINIQFTN